MRWRPLIATLAAALVAAGGVRAQEPEGVQADPGGDILLMPPPKDWVPVQEDREDQLYQLAFLPAGETLDDWEQKLTVQMFRGLLKRRPELTAADFAANLGDLWEKSCDGTRASPISAFSERGYDAAVRLLTCPRKLGSQLGSVSMVKVMQGRASMYLFERAWRGPAFESGAMPVAQETLDSWAEFLATTTLCNPDNEEAPCPPSLR